MPLKMYNETRGLVNITVIRKYMNIGKLTKSELIELANRLLSAETEEESDQLCEEFNK
jgi:hypothetical protein